MTPTNFAVISTPYRPRDGSETFRPRLRQLAGLDQFVDVVVGGQHCRVLEVLQLLALGEGLVAVDAVLTVLRRSHVLEESQDVRVVGSRLPQLVQFPKSGSDGS